MLAVLAEAARKLGAHRLEAEWLPTPRNGPCGDFFAKGSGFAPVSETVFGVDLVEPYPAPAHVELVTAHPNTTAAPDAA